MLKIKLLIEIEAAP